MARESLKPSGKREWPGPPMPRGLIIPPPMTEGSSDAVWEKLAGKPQQEAEQ